MSNHYYTPTATTIENHFLTLAQAETLNQIIETLSHQDGVSTALSAETILSRYFATSTEDRPELFPYRKWTVCWVQVLTCQPVPVAWGWGELESTLFCVQDPVSGERHEVMAEDLVPVDIAQQAQAVATYLDMPH